MSHLHQIHNNLVLILSQLSLTLNSDSPCIQDGLCTFPVHAYREEKNMLVVLRRWEMRNGCNIRIIYLCYFGREMHLISLINPQHFSMFIQREIFFSHRTTKLTSCLRVKKPSVRKIENVWEVRLSSIEKTNKFRLNRATVGGVDYFCLLICIYYWLVIDWAITNGDMRTMNRKKIRRCT